MKKVFFLIISILVLASCSDLEEPIGIWDNIIMLSTRDVELSAETDSVIVTTEGEWWWVNSITFEDSTYSYYNRSDIDLESDFYTIEEDDFMVERRDKTTLFIKVYENPTDEERLMVISLEAGNYFDYIYIKQRAE